MRPPRRILSHALSLAPLLTTVWMVTFTIVGGGAVRNMHRKKVDKSVVETGGKGQSMKDVFASVVQGTTDGKQLPYKQLIA